MKGNLQFIPQLPETQKDAADPIPKKRKVKKPKKNNKKTTKKLDSTWTLAESLKVVNYKGNSSNNHNGSTLKRQTKGTGNR